MSRTLFQVLTRANAPAVAVAGAVILAVSALFALRIARQETAGLASPPAAPDPAAIKVETAAPPRLEVTASPFASEHLNEIIAQKFKKEEERLRAAEEARLKAEAAARATPVPPPVPPPAPARQLVLTYRGLLQRPDAAPLACVEIAGGAMQFLRAGESVQWVKVLDLSRDRLRAETRGQIVELPRGTPVAFTEEAP